MSGEPSPDEAINPEDGRATDLNIISKWARKKCFNTTQFIYNHESDLELNGFLYCTFLEDCSKEMVGLKLLKGADQEEKYRYVNSVWIEATKKKLIVCQMD